MSWVTNGILTDGSPGDILADTGALPTGLSSYTIVFWSNVGGNLELVQRDATNTNDVVKQLVHVDTILHIGAIPINISLNQRLQVRVADGYTGDFQASIIW